MTKTDTKTLIYNLYILITLLVIVIICGGIIIGVLFYKMNSKIDNIEPNIINYHLDPLQGWSEECIENQTITHNRYIDTGGSVELDVYYDGSEYESIIIDGYTFIDTWNETVCSKKILVHNTIVPRVANTYTTIA